MKKLKLFLSLLMLFTFSVGNVWATDPSVTCTFNKSYTITNNQFIENGVTWSIATVVGKGTPTVTTNQTRSSVKCIKFGSSGTQYFSKWELSTDYFKNYNVKSVVACIDNNGKKTGTFTAKQGSVTIGSESKEWSNAWTELTASGATGAGGTLTLTYEVAQCSYLQYITVTYEEGDAPTCTNTVVITKGAELNGTFSLSATEVCGDGEGEDVSVLAIAPATGYEFGEITTSASGTVDNVNKKVIGITAATTIGVVFNELPKYTVSFSTGTGNAPVDALTEEVGGQGITLPAGPTPACSADGWVFAGWATAAVAEQTTTAPTLLIAEANYKPTENVTLHAVYKRSDIGDLADQSVTETFENQTAGSDYQSTQNYTAANSVAELAWTMYYGTVSTNDKISGSNSAQMRLYYNHTDEYGYIKTTTPVSGLQSLNFKARVSSTDVKMSVWYSTDGENWTLSNENETFSETGKGLDFSSTINGTIGTNYYIKIGVGSGATFPSSSNTKLIIDDIKFNYTAGSVTNYYLSAPTCEAPEPTVETDPTSVAFGTVYQHSTVSPIEVTISGENLTADLTAVSSNTDVFTVAVKEGDSLTPTDGAVLASLVITPNTTTAGEFTDTKISIGGGGLADAVEVPVTMTVTPTYAITPVAENGTITWSTGTGENKVENPAYVAAGVTVNAEATANTGYSFKSLTLSDNVSEPTIVENFAEFTMPAGAVTITALFDEVLDPVISGVPAEDIVFPNARQHGTIVDQTFTLTGANLTSKLTLSATEGFTVSPEEITPEAGAVNQLITLSHSTEVADDFVGTLTISGGGLAAAATVNLLLTVTPTYLVQIAVNDANFGSATVAGAASVYAAETDELALEATPNEGYRFVEWTLSADNILITDADAASTTANTIVGAVTITANFELIPTYTAKWYVNGNELTESAQTAVAGTALTFPENPSATGDCAGLVFRGWLTSELAEASATAPEGLITETEGLTMPSNDINYYAVFAEEDATNPSTVVDNIDNSFTGVSGNTYTAWTDKTGTSGAVYAGSTAGDHSSVQLRANKSVDGIVATATATSGKVSKVTITWNSNTSATRTLDIYGKNTAYEAASDLYAAGTQGTKLGSLNIDDATEYVSELAIEGDYTFIGLRSNSGAMYIDNIAIEWTVPGSTVTSNYVTSCPSCATVTLSAASVEHGSIALSKESVKTCEAAEVTVTATPDPGYELHDIELSGVAGAIYSEGVISIPQDAEGTLTVTASFAAVNYTVTLEQTGDASATLSGATDAATYGATINISAPEVEGFVFTKWTTSDAELVNAYASETSFTMPAKNVTVSANYARLYTVAQAIDAIDNGGTTSNVVVEGYITDFYSTSVSSGKISYYIQDLDENGFATGEKFEAYNGKGLNNTNFTQLSDLEVGAKVRIYGNIKYYSTGKVYELDNGNYLISYTDPEFSIAWTRPNDDEAVEVVVDLEKVTEDQYVKTNFFKNVFLTGTYTVKVTSTDVVQSLVFNEAGLYEFQIEFNTTTKELSIETERKGGTTTGVDNTGDGQKAVKVMKDNTIYIIRGDKTYTITGQVVK